jgi:hypothetical protein
MMANNGYLVWNLRIQMSHVAEQIGMCPDSKAKRQGQRCGPQLYARHFCLRRQLKDADLFAQTVRPVYITRPIMAIPNIWDDL